MDSDTDAAPDTDDPDLRERVADLEATVAAQQQTITKMLPGRRGVLKAGGLVAGGGVLGALSADRASAQASGQVGTSSDPVDVEAHDLAVQNQLSSSIDAGGNDLTNVGSLSTDGIDISSTDLISTGDFISFRDYQHYGSTMTTTSTSYVIDISFFQIIEQWDNLPAAVSEIKTLLRIDGRSEGTDVRFFNNTDDEVIFEELNVTSLVQKVRYDAYTPTTTSSPVTLRPEIRADDGSDSAKLDRLQPSLGVQL